MYVFNTYLVSAPYRGFSGATYNATIEFDISTFIDL